MIPADKGKSEAASGATEGSAGTPFLPTRWTLVLRARGETPQARAALSELCDAYYQPVFRFLRREGKDEEAARELTQSFFSRVLQGEGFAGADPGRGRFRSYLLGAVKHFLADQRKHDSREKRGGGLSVESLQAATEEGEASAELAVSTPGVPDTWFDRQWALALLDRTLNRLQEEFHAAGKASQFEQLQPWLMGEIPTLSQAEAGQRLGMNEGAIKVAVHRLRKRFRELIASEISQTLAEGEEVQTELRYLLEVLTQP